MMLGSADLLRGWVLATLAGLATDDEHHARLRDMLLVFLQSGGSYKAAAEEMMLHKNTVQYRIGKAEESLARPAGENRHDVELALRVSHWLGSSVLQPSAASGRCWLVDFGGVYARHDAVGDQAEASQLLERQDVDDQRPHVGDVPGRRFGERLKAFIGQDGVGEPPVGRIRLTAHQASLLKALDQV
jgi:hypothetical protein